MEQQNKNTKIKSSSLKNPFSAGLWHPKKIKLGLTASSKINVMKKVLNKANKILDLIVLDNLQNIFQQSLILKSNSRRKKFISKAIKTYLESLTGKTYPDLDYQLTNLNKPRHRFAYITGIKAHNKLTGKEVEINCNIEDLMLPEIMKEFNRRRASSVLKRVKRIA